MEHSGANRRWRGTLDVPLNNRGLSKARDLGWWLMCWSSFDLVIHDDLSRCRDTARSLYSKRYIQNSVGPRPWRMGTGFEGKPVTDVSIGWAQLLIAMDSKPKNGERFSEWLEDWMTFVHVMNYSYPNDVVAIVTHNRNIQALYSHHDGEFYQKLYDVEGPGFLSVHYYKDGYIAPWQQSAMGGDGKLIPGLYIIRHGETAWGT